MIPSNVTNLKVSSSFMAYQACFSIK